MHANVNFLILFLFGLCAEQANGELSGLLSALQYLGLKIQPNGAGSQSQVSRGQCEYTFEAYALMRERHLCVPDDEHIMHMTEVPQQRKPPLRIRCLDVPDLSLREGNITLPKLLIMESAKEIVNLLKPIGNATKRHEYGSCVVMHFCTPTSLECARIANVINLLPHLFPNLPVAYVDAYKFSRFNAEFGIVSLPTTLIFHQGRPMLKYDPAWDETSRLACAKFIMRHTNLKTVDPRSIKPYVLSWTKIGPLLDTPDFQTDFYLGLAWAFILLCLANYVRRTLIWKQLVEMVQRNWRESEETQMEMVD
ncbi:thioredoxin domain-containing protein 15 [Drosophila innubila]|uniref:thioredoxin domain-containing protein 15 n=1 Tax=Drosophila innubila TaxID=198719 RepID=UPI00148BC959|nr:thioredoxin domain-containing protein 15 [Drosophila innubila]